jgi:amino acid permease
LAIMSFPYSYATLGMVPGLILTVIVALFVQYTSLVLWEFCLRHPEVRDVCDIGQMLFFGKTWAWYATAVMFILNNTFIQVRTVTPPVSSPHALISLRVSTS